MSEVLGSRSDGMAAQAEKSVMIDDGVLPFGDCRTGQANAPSTASVPVSSYYEKAR